MWSSYYQLSLTPRYKRVSFPTVLLHKRKTPDEFLKNRKLIKFDCVNTHFKTNKLF